MGRWEKWAALRPHLWHGMLVLAVLWAAPTHTTAAEAPPACTPVVARIVSIEGLVEIRRSGQANWSAVKRLDTPMCEGDLLHAGARSRAALVILPEKFVRLDQNSTVSIAISGDETVVEFFQDETTPKDACGAGYFITRFPRKFKVRTPFVNAAVEGTEFMVSMSCSATAVAVFEGKVSAETLLANAQRFILNSGQTLTAGLGEPPAVKVLIKPVDAVQWALYYAPLSRPGPGVGPDQACDQPAPDEKSRCLMVRAEQRLRVGRVEEAQADIDASLKLVPDNSDADALFAVISIAKNDNQRALAHAQQATRLNPVNPRAWIALSYAQQANFKLEDALTSAQRAAELEPSSSIALARLAELMMSLGRIRSAARAAQAAVEANPDDSRAHTILGFVQLAQLDVNRARASFEQAIALDSSDPLPRLGLGLAIIRRGNLTGGREQIEIAVAVDPTNSLLRSYVGKAYFEENTRERDKLAATQYGLAKQLDPKDPTPWFYDAILKQTQNRPMEALENLQKSVDLNNNRAVFRSKFLLDDDAAARSASVAEIYLELGFEQLAINESTSALADNFGNASAHRMLAQSYADLPRHEIARVSEALQAQIRQPLSLPWVSPLIGTDNLLILRDVGPSTLGMDEFNLLFNRDQGRLQLDGVGGSRSTWGDQVVVSGLSGNVSAAVGQLHYQTDGFVDNGAAQKDIYDVFLRGQLAPTSSVQVNLKRADTDFGKTFFAFDPTIATPTTIQDRSDIARIGGHQGLDPSADLIWTAAYEDRERQVESSPDGGLFESSNAHNYVLEIQHLNRFRQGQLIVGGGYVQANENFQLESIDVSTEAANIYAYGQWQAVPSHLTLELGLAAEWFNLRNSFFSNNVERNRISPKLGLVWTPQSSTTVRLAAFDSVRRPFIGSATLEPTQVAGFNQFFRDFEMFYGDIQGTTSHVVGAAIDQVLSPTAFVGLEVTNNHMNVPSITMDQDFAWKETWANLYFYKGWTPKSGALLPGTLGAAVTAAVEYNRLDRPQIKTGSDGIMALTTIRTPLGISLFDSNGFTGRVVTAYVKQEGQFSADEGFLIVPKNDNAWITDFYLEYRLPQRLGAVAFGVKNLFDSSIDLVELDPLNPRIATRRLVFGRVRLVF